LGHYKPVMKIINAFFLFCILLFICSCKKTEQQSEPNSAFKWFANGTNFHYDLYTSSGIIKNYETLSVVKNSYTGNLDLTESAQTDTIGGSLYFEDLQGEYVVKSDGLYAITVATCEYHIVDYPTFTSQFLPNNPKVGQQIPVYFCQGDVVDTINVLALNQSVTVPYGTFNTYVMQYNYGQKGYWDPNTGLVMYERFDNNGNLSGTLKLDNVTRQ
jgi:hypothetical protein